MSIRLQLLGGFALAARPGETLLRPAPKARALLCWLAAIGPAGGSRAQAAALLWDDRGEADARNSLRQCLHQLRRSLAAAAPALQVDAERLALDPLHCDVDLWRFEELVRHDGHPGAAADGAEVYRGDFADGIAVGAAFDPWLARERERCRTLARRVLTRLAAAPQSEQGLAIAVSLAQRLLTADPLHEGTHLALIQLYTAAGLRAKAAEAWLDCRRALRRELGVAPSAASAALADELLGTVMSESAEAASPSPGVPPAAWRAANPAAFSRQRGEAAVLDLMLRGWQLFGLYERGANRGARAAFAAVVDQQPGHAEARALMGFTHWLDAISGWCPDPSASLDAAEACAAQALACGRDTPTALQLQGKLLIWQHRHPEAAVPLRGAVELAPAAAYGHFHLGEWAMWCGRSQEALAHLDRALALDANDHGVFLTIRGLAMWRGGELESARRALASAITRNPGYAWAHGAMATVLSETGEAASARQAAATARRLNPRFSVDFAARILPLAEPATRERFVRAWRLAGMPARESLWTPQERG